MPGKSLREFRDMTREELYDLAADRYELDSLHRTAMIGTPEEVIERLRFYQTLGVDEFSFWCDNSLPHQEKRKSLELFSKEVAPAFV